MVENEEYEGREISYEEDHSDPQLRVDGRRVDITYIEEEDSFATKYIPYANFDSLSELGEAIVNNWSRIEQDLTEEEDQ